jgi:hypothetical protein
MTVLSKNNSFCTCSNYFSELFLQPVLIQKINRTLIEIVVIETHFIFNLIRIFFIS